MASSSGSMTTNSSAVQSSGSEEDLRALMDQRKRKRMISNRESARRSRMRKQKHLDELVSQMTELQKDNQRIAADLNAVAQGYMRVAAENSILRAQADELVNRLQSLEEIIGFLGSAGAGAGAPGPAVDSLLMDPVSMGFMNQPILASADMFQY